MNKACFVCLMSGFFAAFSLAAPAAPLAQFPTGDAAWTVAVTYHNPALGNPKKVRNVVVTQVDNIKRIVVTWVSGPTTEEWRLPGLNVIFKQYPTGVFTMPALSPEAQTDENLIPSDAPNLTWITAQCLQEQTPISYQGKVCFHYKTSTEEAWIESATLLPVGIDSGNMLCLYTYQDPPPTLVPPQDFADEIKYYKHVMGYQ